MSDLDRAIAASREADAEVARLSKTNKKSAWMNALAVSSMRHRDLLAALDAARGQAVAWQGRQMRDGAEWDSWEEIDSPQTFLRRCTVPAEVRCLFAAPPAAAVPPDLSDAALILKHASVLENAIAINAGREAYIKGNTTSVETAERLAGALRQAAAMLDAARGQAVATVCEMDRFSHGMRLLNRVQVAVTEGTSLQPGTKLFAALPAAAVPAERLGIVGDKAVIRAAISAAATLPQAPPAAAVPEPLIEAACALLARDMRNTCQHGNTYRGGVLWEICEDCGAKWADDEGGKPEWRDPPEWEALESAIAAARAAPPAAADSLQAWSDGYDAARREFEEPAPPAAPVVMLPYGWHLVPRHLPDEVLVDTGSINGYDGQRGDAEHRAWWESAIDSLAVRVPLPVLTYTQAPPAAAVPEGYALVPAEPTEAMLEAAWDSDAADYVGEHKRIHSLTLAWAAMLAASKAQP